jgi:phosphoribosyl 1,2-cyclic phosphate phosphodiesterase
MPRPSLEILFLGTGTSHGVPMMGCDCAVCTSADPRNQRTRSSILIEVDGLSLLVDTATELRIQAIRERLDRVDAVLFTHDHADHLHGIDDLRAFCQKHRMLIPLYGNQQTLDTIRMRWSYMFQDPEFTQRHLNVARLGLCPVSGPFRVGEVEVVPIPLLHGDAEILGYRVGQFAYLTDCSEIPDTSIPLLQGLDTLVIDGLRQRPHRTHFSLGQACLAAARLRPRRTYLTHLTHNVDHATVDGALPAGVHLAYDGLRLTCPW